MKRRFEVYFVGMFWAYALLDEKGREMFDLSEAAALAERMYETGWREVSNGEEGITREQWLEEKPS